MGFARYVTTPALRARPRSSPTASGRASPTTLVESAAGASAIGSAIPSSRSSSSSSTPTPDSSWTSAGYVGPPQITTAPLSACPTYTHLEVQYRATAAGGAAFLRMNGQTELSLGHALGVHRQPDAHRRIDDSEPGIGPRLRAGTITPSRPARPGRASSASSACSPTPTVRTAHGWTRQVSGQRPLRVRRSTSAQSEHQHLQRGRADARGRSAVAIRSRPASPAR